MLYCGYDPGYQAYVSANLPVEPPISRVYATTVLALFSLTLIACLAAGLK
jgi:hypothetical protein